MKHVSVIYWSSTGNTEAMANAVAEGVTAGGAAVKLMEVSAANAADLKDAETFALGCPAMGAEQLDDEMDAFVSEIEGFVSGKTIGLFGSYDWGDGEWMREWASRMEQAGAVIAGGEGVIANNTPDDEAIAACHEMGKLLA